MEDILRKLLSNDGDAVREASRLLKENINKPETVGVLCTLLGSHQNAEIRQYATIILRKRFDKKTKWQSQDPATRAELKNGLLQVFIKEPEKSVKNCLAQLIGTILKHDYPEWNELMAFLQQSMTSENSNDVELGFYMLSILTEICPEEMQHHAHSFCAHFSTTINGLTDKASPVGYFIMLCLAHMCPSLTNNKQLINIYNELIPKTYEIVYALAEKRPDRASEVLDLYYELVAEKAAHPLLSTKMKGIINLCLDLTQKSKNEDLQIKALNFISTLATVKAKQLLKEGIMTNILTVIFSILKTPPMDEEDEQYFNTDTSDDTLFTCACETLDCIALNADTKKLMNLITQMVDPAFKSGDIYEKKAGILVMGIVCQGCETYVRANLMKDLIELVRNGINEPSPLIRNVSLFTLGQMGEHLQPEISASAVEVMPLLINQLDRLGEEGKNGGRLGQRVDRLFYAIERFSETLETSLSHFLNELIPRLLVLAAAPFHVHIRELALAAVATAASSVEQGIIPYFNDIMNVLNMYLSPQAASEASSLQVEALDTLAMLARHVGPNEFGPLALDSVKLGLELVSNTDDPDIRKSSYGLFGSVSNVLKGEMGPLLQSIVTPILNSIKDQQAFIVHNRDDANAAFPLYDSDDENEEDDDLDDISIENDYVEEKEEACFALKELAMNTGESFAPYLEASIEEVYKLLNFPSIEVRKAALEAEAQFCISFVQIMYNTSQGDNKLAIIIMEKLIVKTIEVIKTDLSMEVAFTGLESLQVMLKQIGPQIGCADQLKLIIIGTIKDILYSKVECQTLSEPTDDEMTEAELMDAASDVIPLLSKAMSPEEFAMVFTDLLPILRNRVLHGDDDVYSDSEEDDEENQGSRANTIGVIAECMAPLGMQLGQFVTGLFPYLLGLIKDSDTNVRNNALYTIGEMALHGRDHMFQNYSTILNALSQVLSSETKPKVLDNACGVIARMILTNVELIPLQQVFRALIAQLPLKEDVSEDIWVMKAISHVMEVAPDVAQSEIFPILQDAGFSLYAHAPDQECKDVILNLFRSAISRFPQECQVVMPQLPHNCLEILRETGIINN